MLRSSSKLALQTPEEPRPYQNRADAQTGIEFCLPTRRRIIPYAWLLYAEVNQDETEFILCYTYCIVTVEGEKLGGLQEYIQGFKLEMVRESSNPSTGQEIRVRRITITEKE